MSLSQFSHVNIWCSDRSSTATFQTLKRRFMQALENSRCPNNRAGGCYWQVMVFRLCGWWCSIYIWILSISVMSTSKRNIKEPSVWSNHVTSQLRTWEHVFQTQNLHSFAWTGWTKLNVVILETLYDIISRCTISFSHWKWCHDVPWFVLIYYITSTLLLMSNTCLCWLVHVVQSCKLELTNACYFIGVLIQPLQ